MTEELSREYCSEATVVTPGHCIELPIVVAEAGHVVTWVRDPPWTRADRAPSASPD